MRAPRPAQQPPRVGAGDRVGVEQLVAEAHDRSVQPDGALEDVDLAARDQLMCSGSTADTSPSTLVALPAALQISSW